MKKIVSLFWMFLVISLPVFSQVGIGTTNPDNSSMLDVTSTTKGLLIPRMTTAERLAISSAADGLMVYDLTTHSVWFYKNGTWNEVTYSNGSGSGPSWLISGNNGTTSSNFLGTTDNVPLRFRVNNLPSGIIENGNTGFGYNTLANISSGTNNLALGQNALQNTTTGERNIAIGYNALNLNTTGATNVAIGGMALSANIDGLTNVAVGMNSLQSLTTGEANNGFGNNALQLHTSGDNNVAVGTNAGHDNLTGSGNLFLGHTAGYYETGDDKLYIANSDATFPLVWGDFNASVLGINGRVGIGTQTPNSDFQLHVYNSANPSMSNILVGPTWGGMPGTPGVWVRSALVNEACGLSVGGSHGAGGITWIDDNRVGTNGPYMTIQSAFPVLIQPGGVVQYVGIGTDNPTAKLHIASVSGTPLRIENLGAQPGSTQALVVDANGVVYKGGAGTGMNWSITGNTGTTPGTNFLGTTDNQDLVFKVNNQNAGRINSVGYTLFGYQAGNVNTSDHSTFVGMWSGKVNTSGDNNIGLGYESLFSNTTGASNIAIGNMALTNNTNGQNSVAIGHSALATQSYTGGTVWNAFNVAVGNGALQNNQPSSTLNGIQNTAIGHEAMNSNTTGYSNTAAGYRALFSNTTATRNSAFGYQALYTGTNFSGQSAFGYQALYSNTTGQNNSAFGDRALYTNRAGGYNAAFGSQALFLNDNGGYNSSVGYWAMKNNVSGAYNNATGAWSLYTNSSGAGNNAYGYYALYNSNGSYNNAFGYQAMSNSSAGTYNNAFGAEALQSNTTGSFNVVMGYRALLLNTTGYSNTVLGTTAGNGNQDGVRNVFLGDSAGFLNVSGSKNIFIGYQAGLNETNSQKLYIENSSASASNALLYGEFDNDILATNGKFGVGTISPSTKLHVVGSTGVLDPLRLEGLESNASTTVLVVDGSGVVKTNSAIGTGAGLWSRSGGKTYLTNSTDPVGIGVTTPDASLHVRKNATGEQDLLKLERAFVTAAPSTTNLVFSHQNDKGNMATFAKITWDVTSVNEGAEESSWKFSTLNRGNMDTALWIGHNGEVRMSNRLDVNGSIYGHILHGLGSLTLDNFAALNTQTAGSDKDLVMGYGGLFKQLRFEANGSERMRIDADGNLGIGTDVPASALSVGANSEFQVNSTGNIVKLNNVATSFPSSQGAANSFLKNDGSGNLSWSSDLPGTGNVTMTATGGMAILLTNKSGGTLLKGTLVQAAATADLSFVASAADSEYPIGVLAADCANNTQGWVVVSGIAEVLIKDGTSAAAGNWCGSSDVAGRAYMTTSGAPGSNHDKEIGHCLQTVTSGTNVLAKAVLHFR
jgi:trimeric autotransporter adhesin